MQATYFEKNLSHALKPLRLDKVSTVDLDQACNYCLAIRPETAGVVTNTFDRMQNTHEIRCAETEKDSECRKPVDLGAWSVAGGNDEIAALPDLLQHGMN